MSFRYAAKIDSSQQPIVDYLRERGCSVYFIARPVDLIIGHFGVTYLAELKTQRVGKRKITSGKFKPDQVKFFQTWSGAPAVVLETLEDAEALLTGNWRKLVPTTDDLRRIRD